MLEKGILAHRIQSKGMDRRHGKGICHQRETEELGGKLHQCVLRSLETSIGLEAEN